MYSKMTISGRACLSPTYVSFLPDSPSRSLVPSISHKGRGAFCSELVLFEW